MAAAAPAVGMPDQPGHLFCFGLGYSALALVKTLANRGWTVAGTVRSENKAQALRGEGIDAHLFDGTAPLTGAARLLGRATHILASVPPDDAGDPVVRHHASDIADAQPGWLGYLSTTGVYGNHDGDWVDETTPLTPSGVRGRRRQAAEQAWMDLYAQAGVPVHLFRLAGIYGPGRNAVVSLRTGSARRIVKPGQVFSRIHVADIVQVIAASMARPAPGRAYNVCDDEPAPPQDLIAHAADLTGLPAPPETPFDAADLSPMARSFYADNKRVRNDRIKTELGVTLAYPTYREGLAALADDQPA